MMAAPEASPLKDGRESFVALSDGTSFDQKHRYPKLANSVFNDFCAMIVELVSLTHTISAFSCKHSETFPYNAVGLQIAKQRFALLAAEQL